MPKENYKYYKFKISIILASYQSHSSIAHSLSNILLQDFPLDSYEVIAISHGIEDGITGHLFNLVKNLKRLHIENGYKKRRAPPYQACFVRNKGIEVAEGKLVFFMHDNVNLIGRDYLKKLWELSNNGNRAVITKKIVYLYNKDGTIRKSDDIYGFYAQQDAIPLKYLNIVGGFDEIYDGDHGYDDIDLMKRCKDVGCEFYGAGKDSDVLMSVRHNLVELYPKQRTFNGKRNEQIAARKGFL